MTDITLESASILWQNYKNDTKEAINSFNKEIKTLPSFQDHIIYLSIAYFVCIVSTLLFSVGLFVQYAEKKQKRFIFLMFIVLLIGIVPITILLLDKLVKTIDKIEKSYKKNQIALIWYKFKTVIDSNPLEPGDVYKYEGEIKVK